MISTSIPTLSQVHVAPYGDKRLPLIIRPVSADTDPVTWARAQREAVDRLICEYGALLFRGFSLPAVDTFEQFSDAACHGDWMKTREGSTPRTQVHTNVFSSTEYDPRLRLYAHNENSFVTTWPLYIFFHCRVPAIEGGYTPVTDCRAVYRRLPAQIVERFDKVGWLYRRNFHQGSTVTWQKAFATDSREDVEHYCRENHMVPEWTKNGLTVRFRRWAALRHPRTGQMVWFNHGTVFNEYTREPAIKAMIREMGEEWAPYSTCYGDGTAIEHATMRTLDEAYAAETVSFPWEAGDVLMLDNMSVAHGRQPYSGPREVLIAMKWKISCGDVADYRHYGLTSDGRLASP